MPEVISLALNLRGRPRKTRKLEKHENEFKIFRVARDFVRFVVGENHVASITDGAGAAGCEWSRLSLRNVRR